MNNLVSILIPCYNHEKYIDSCLESIIAQSYENIEVLICDDCSQDSSFEKLMHWKPVLESRFPRVEICKNKVNLGVCKTLNGLIERSRGTYIKTLASDDMMDPNAIADYVDFAGVTECDVVFSNAYLINEYDKFPIDTSIIREKYYSSIPLHGKKLTENLIAGNFIQGASLFIQKQAFEKYGVFDERYLYEDWEFLLRVSVFGTIEYMDKTPIYYRVLDGSLSHYDSISEKSRKKFRIFYRDMKDLFEKYSNYASDSSKCISFNQSIRTAIVLNDHMLVNEITRDMNALGLRVLFANKVRIWALRLGIYNFLRTAKNLAKARRSNAGS